MATPAGPATRGGVSRRSSSSAFASRPASPPKRRHLTVLHAPRDLRSRAAHGTCVVYRETKTLKIRLHRYPAAIVALVAWLALLVGVRAQGAPCCQRARAAACRMGAMTDAPRTAGYGLQPLSDEQRRRAALAVLALLGRGRAAAAQREVEEGAARPRAEPRRHALRCVGSERRRRGEQGGAGGPHAAGARRGGLGRRAV